MLKLISLFLTLLLSFNANAFVKQSLSDTLTYDNIVDSSSSKNDNHDFTPPQPQNNDITDKTKNKLKKVNLKNKYSDKINLEPNDTVEITLNLENNPDAAWGSSS